MKDFKHAMCKYLHQEQKSGFTRRSVFLNITFLLLGYRDRLRNLTALKKRHENLLVQACVPRDIL